MSISSIDKGGISLGNRLPSIRRIGGAIARRCRSEAPCSIMDFSSLVRSIFSINETVGLMGLHTPSWPLGINLKL